MKLSSTALITFTFLSIAGLSACAQDTGSSFYGDGPDEHHPWAVHDKNRPQPKIVTPGTFSSQAEPGKPPSDAIILFDGTDLEKWEADSNGHAPTKWVIRNGAMECVPGSGFIRTKDSFGDIQLHVEWAAPTKVEGTSQGRGNSGVFLLGLVEVQVLDNYNNPTYADGMAGAVYGQHAPLANALRAPGEFQVYDIIFRRPLYRESKLAEPGYVTVFENGVAVEDHAIIEGPTGHMKRAVAETFPDTGPLKLQDHGNPVRYRNIWYRTLPPRVLEGGSDGYLSTEVTTAKRKELATTIRDDAQKLEGTRKMLRLAESLEYDNDEATAKTVQELADQYVTALAAVPAETVASKRNEARSVRDALVFLAKFKVIPTTWDAKVKLDQFIKDHNWDRRGRGQ